MPPSPIDLDPADTSDGQAPEPARLPLGSLLLASVCGILWHGLLLTFGCFMFEPPKTVVEPRKPQEFAARTVADEAGENSRRWYHWDALWFAHLGRHGYVLETDHDGNMGQSNIAFTPGLALVVAAASEGKTGKPWEFLLGFNSVMAWWAMLGLGALTWRLTHSRAAMIWAIVAFNAWPWRFFLAAPYQEAAGAALTFWGMYAACSGSVVPGFACSFLASAFRLNAVGAFCGLFAGSFLELLRQRERSLQVRRMILSSGALIGWGVLLAYFHRRFGDAGLGVKIQSTWGRQPPHLTGLFESLGAPLLHPMTGTEWLDWAAAWALVAAIPLVYRSYGLIWASSLAGLTFQALSTGRVLSFGRFALLACPFFVLAGQFAARRPRSAMVISAMWIVAQLGLAWRYGHDLFAG